MEVSKLAIVGAGFVGGPTGAVFASKHPGLDVCVLDANPGIIQAY
jgi:UDPglucose 6-dehydrogenase